MRTILLCTLLLSFLVGSADQLRAAAPMNGLTDAEKRGGWKLLFDGKSTDGWRNYQKDSISDGWKVVDGALVRSGNGAGDIISTDQFEDFELALEYRISKGGNSGVMLRVTEEGAKPWHSGPEVQIQDNIDGHDGQKAGWLYQLYKPTKPDWARMFENQVGFKSPEVDDATYPAGEWNHLYLRISKQGCEVCMNGVSYYKFLYGGEDWDQRVAKSKFAKLAGFAKAAKGHICLQDHGNEVAFRSIKIREIPKDGKVSEPIDGTLKLKPVEAFPNLTWENWSGVDERGRVQTLRPISMTHAGDGSNRAFVATQRGMIFVFKVEPDVKQAKMLLDLRDKVHNFAKDNEEGLLGFALHPKFKENGEFFIYYNAADEPRVAYLSRFRMLKDDPNRADPKSEERIMRIEQPFSNHNGGPMKFGKDGYLYIGFGDGGGRNDPTSKGQDLSTWMGKILRIDVDHKDEGKNYAVPKDNPFVDRKGAKPEIYAYGIRNPWRLTVDRKTGAIWVGDVGQDLWEEIHIIRRGGNYGWSIREGNYGFNNGLRKGVAAPQDSLIDPIWEYDHQVGKSITGGYVYRGNRLPELEGAYLYGDYVTGKIYALYYDQENKKVIKNMAVPSTGIAVLSFGEDELGEVYYMVESVRGRCFYQFDRVE